MKHGTRVGISLATALLASGAIAHTAQAQANPIAFGIQAGATKAVGDGSDGIDLGYHAGALVQWTGAGSPLGFRGDVMYHRFSVKDVDANESITAGTVNAVYTFPMDAGSAISPYIIGGVGYYHLSVSCDNCEGVSFTDNKFGLNGGGGVSFPLSGFSAFIEARYHHIFTDGGSTGMVPISVGLMFR